MPVLDPPYAWAVFQATLLHVSLDELARALRAADGLSSRGSLTFDPKENTIYIRDLPPYAARARDILLDSVARSRPRVPDPEPEGSTARPRVRPSSTRSPA